MSYLVRHSYLRLPYAVDPTDGVLRFAEPKDAYSTFATKEEAEQAIERAVAASTTGEDGSSFWVVPTSVWESELSVAETRARKISKAKRQREPEAA